MLQQRVCARCVSRVAHRGGLLPLPTWSTRFPARRHMETHMGVAVPPFQHDVAAAVPPGARRETRIYLFFGVVVD